MTDRELTDLSDFELITIAENLANDDYLPMLATLSRTCKRLRAICAPLIAQHFEESEARFKINDKGDREYFECGALGRIHRYKDQPAIIRANGSRGWYWRGQLHRDNDQPAVIYADGTREWYQRGQLHRDNDQPAIIFTSGTREWYQRNVLHRGNNEPAIIHANGSREWYVRGQLHRDNDASGTPLPAVIRADGSREWYVSGKLHRDNDQSGKSARPAVICAGDIRAREWWINGTFVRRE